MSRPPGAALVARAAPLAAALVGAALLAAACAPAAPPDTPAGAAAAPARDTVREPPPDPSLVPPPRARGAAGAPGSASPQPALSQPATMRPLAESAHLFTSQDAQGGEPGLRVLRDRTAWEAAWRALQAGLAAGPAPAVDFAREMVVVVAAGQKPSGGYAVRVDGTSEAPDGALLVHVTATAPGEGCMSTMALTSPVDVVRVPRAAGAVRAVTRTVAEPC